MPVILRFYGIAIKMYFKEHGVPHFHAVYGEFNGFSTSNTLEMIEGDLPAASAEARQGLGKRRIGMNWRRCGRSENTNNSPASNNENHRLSQGSKR